jgi:hypothetical protein
MELMDKDTAEFRKLKSFIFEGEYSEIDKWFKEFNLSKKYENALILRMINDSYLFSFRSFSTNREVLKQERLNREISILKNLRCENQLKLFNVTAIEDLSHKHIEVIKLTPKNKELIRNSNNMAFAIADLLNNENFAEIDKIQSMLKMNLLEKKINGVIFHHKQDGSRGTYYFKINEEIFSPKFNIVSIYTDAKKEYLLNKGIALPSIEEVEYLKTKITQYISSNLHQYRQEDSDKVNGKYNDYIIQKSYLDLNNELNNNNKTNKKHKI